MSQRALGRQFYHASSRDFQPGDVLTPGARRGDSNFDTSNGNAHNDRVFMSDNLEDAHTWAEVLMHGNANSEHPNDIGIYAVRPRGRVVPRLLGNDMIEHVAPSAVVKAKIETVPNLYLPADAPRRPAKAI